MDNSYYIRCSHLYFVKFIGHRRIINKYMGHIFQYKLIELNFMAQYTGMMLLEEMASIFLTPYLLLFVVPKVCYSIHHIQHKMLFIKYWLFNVVAGGRHLEVHYRLHCGC